MLRRLGRLDRALVWYSLSLAEEPNDHDTHTALGFTYHLLGRFDEAISSYHKALALHPSSAFCAEMLSRALEDTCTYTIYNNDLNSQQNNMYSTEEDDLNMMSSDQ